MSWERQPLEDHEATALLEAAPQLSQSHHLVVATLLHTGMRADELAHMHSSWVNWAQAELSIKVQPTDSWSPKSEAGHRIIPIRNPDVRRLLSEHFSDEESMGISRTTIWRRVDDTAEHADISTRCSPHVLRHTYGTQLAARGASAQYIKQTMGHVHLATSQQYIQFSGRRLHEEADRLYQ